jgi:tetratricopeptide (TPR) repeat protein
MALVENLDLFHFGVRLAQLGRYSGAIQLLERFRDHFAGREVLTDLGYAYYQLAMKALAACDGAPTMRFRLPVAIDDETLAERARLRGGSSTCLESESVRKQVEEARRNLDLAIDKDPRYLPARHNLLALELVAGSAATATQDAEETLEVAPGDTAALLAKAVGIYRVGVEFNMDGMQEAEKLLQEAEADPRREADAVYAHAVMLTEQSRFANVQAEWERFLRLEPHGDYADYARERLGRPAVPRPPAISAPGPPIPLGVVTAETMATLASYEQWPFDLGVAYRGQGLRILQLGDAIEVVEQTVSPTHPAPSPPQGAIPVRVETPRGVFLRYPGVGFDMEGDRVRSVVYFAPAR